MKSKLAIFSTLFCLFGVLSVNASDCRGDGCIINSEKPVKYLKPAPLPEKSNFDLTQPVAPVWDGGQKYTYKGFDKTVDWRDGVPIWDDSISSYKEKDFRDWPMYGPEGTDCMTPHGNEPQFTENPNIEITSKEVGDGLYEISCGVNIDNAEVDGMKKSISNINDKIEELLIPLRPQLNMWASQPEQDLSNAVKIAFEEPESDGCPFETESECEIWRKKPMVRETVSARSPKIRAEMMNKFIIAASENNKITANDPVAAPILDRYKMLMQSAQACCTDGMIYELKQAGADEGLIYKFLSDDANFYGIGNRCLMMSDTDFDEKYTNTATAAVAADVRNGCLCRGRQWFTAMLAPFQEAYKAAPEFANSKFNYTYTDGLKREITVSVNTDVKNVLNQLSLCP
ncbi:MAG: hypothetical protein JW974_03365 [Alphaproteobacteria bacterium]|nr:hypothetical protein [Alphaproteobacteria bacterium]MBN2675277.1 hypothetical protein [Alphaproteobacteria bacterium]